MNGASPECGTSLTTCRVAPRSTHNAAGRYELLAEAYFNSRGVRISPPQADWLANAASRAARDAATGPYTPNTATAAVVPVAAPPTAAPDGGAAVNNALDAPDDQEAALHEEDANSLPPPLPPPPPAAPTRSPINWRVERPVSQIYLGTRYLRLLDAHDQRPVSEVMPLLCANCDRTLTYADQVRALPTAFVG